MGFQAQAQTFACVLANVHAAVLPGVDCNADCSVSGITLAGLDISSGGCAGTGKTGQRSHEADGGVTAVHAPLDSRYISKVNSTLLVLVTQVFRVFFKGFSYTSPMVLH